LAGSQSDCFAGSGYRLALCDRQAMNDPVKVHGFILLAGGAEFGGRMAEPDRRAMALAGGKSAPVRILPTAAAPDDNHERAGSNGLRWFRKLGALDVQITPVIDYTSANASHLADELRSARLIYLLGGFPAYLAQTLWGSLCWQAALAAYKSGAVIAGSSAGAMVLCQHLYDPYSGTILPGLNLLPGTCFLAHHNSFGKHWAGQLTQLLPDTILIGVDEQTAIINDGEHGWSVSGAGKAALYQAGRVSTYSPGERIHLSQCI
jgi:cyanophycinase